MKIACPKCKSQVPAANVNVATDVAVCPQCGEAFPISSVVAGGGAAGNFDVNAPPRGAWLEDLGSDWTIGATTRSPMAFFLVPFLCVWSGGSLGAIYRTQIAKGEFNLATSLFGIPFLLGTLVFGSLALMYVCGKVVVSVDRDAGRVFTGVGPFGWTRRFDWDAVTGVEENLALFTQNSWPGGAIALVGQSRLKFGSMLSQGRRYFMLQALRKMLAGRKG